MKTSSGHALRNALRLDPVCADLIDHACTLRRLGRRGAMRAIARYAIYRARLRWRTYADLPPAA